MTYFQQEQKRGKSIENSKVGVVDQVKKKNSHPPLPRRIFNLFAFGAVLLALIFFLFPRKVTIKLHSSSSDPKAKRVLFIGNSLTYTFDAPEQFSKIIKLARPNQTFSAFSATGPNFTLAEHLSDRNTMSLLTKSKWDYIVLQEGTRAIYGDYQEAKESLEEFKTIAEQQRAKLILIKIPGDKNSAADKSRIANFFDKIDAELKLKTLPIGDFVFFCQNNQPQLKLYDTDNHHPGPDGALLYACLVAREIAGFTISDLQKSLVAPEPSKRQNFTPGEINSLRVICSLWNKYESTLGK